MKAKTRPCFRFNQILFNCSFWGYPFRNSGFPKRFKYLEKSEIHLFSQIIMSHSHFVYYCFPFPISLLRFSIKHFLEKHQEDVPRLIRRVRLNHFHKVGRTHFLNRRIIEWFGLEATLKIIWFQTPCHEQGHLLLHQVAQSPIQPGLEGNYQLRTLKSAGLLKNFTLKCQIVDFYM